MIHPALVGCRWTLRATMPPPPPLMGGARVYNCLLLLLCHPHNMMEQSLEPVSTKGTPSFDLTDLAVKQTLISVDKKTEDAGRFLEEPLLKENPNRFVLFPIQDNEVRLCVYIYIYFYNLWSLPDFTCTIISPCHTYIISHPTYHNIRHHIKI